MLDHLVRMHLDKKHSIDESQGQISFTISLAYPSSCQLWLANAASLFANML
jgi:hypothetical protein